MREKERGKRERERVTYSHSLSSSLLPPAAAGTGNGGGGRGKGLKKQEKVVFSFLRSFQHGKRRGITGCRSVLLLFLFSRVLYLEHLVHERARERERERERLSQFDAAYNKGVSLFCLLMSERG